MSDTELMDGELTESEELESGDGKVTGEPRKEKKSKTGGKGRLCCGLEMKILLAIVVTVTSILAGLGVYDYFDGRQEMTAELRQLGENVSDRLKTGLVNPLWDFDEDSAFVALVGEMKEEVVFGIVVYDADGKEIFAAMTRDKEWKPVKTDKVPEGKFVEVGGKVVREDKPIGQYKVLLTEKFMMAALQKMIYTIILETLAIDFAIVIVLALFIRRFVMGPLNRIQAFAGKVGEGDLDAVIEPGKYTDELLVLKNAMETMVGSLIEKMGEVREGQKKAEEQTRKAKEAAKQADAARQQAESARREGMMEAASILEEIVSRIINATQGIGTQVFEASDGAAKQAVRSTETATAMEEMNATVLEVARNAGETANQADDARAKARQGADVVSQAVATIQQVDAKTDELKRNMTELNTMAQNTGQILSVITDIADQTNLLALNAAIEAARAGEAGRGFAVVADEVRKLAEKTMDATKQVEQSIGGIRSSAEMSGTTTDEADVVVKKATELANESGAALEEILSLVEQTSVSISSIATAAEEQSATSEEITKSVEEINVITEETTKGMQIASQSVDDLKGMVDELEKLISQLKQ